jgi:hypothetical protein
MAQFKRVLERFMPQDEQQEGDAAAADGEDAAAAPAAAADAAGPAHSDADSDEEGEWNGIVHQQHSFGGVVQVVPADTSSAEAVWLHSATSACGGVGWSRRCGRLPRSASCRILLVAITAKDSGIGLHVPACAFALPLLLPGGEDGSGKLSKKQRKLLHRLKIAELKQQCARPDVVEVWDVTAPDPNTLVTLKVGGMTDQTPSSSDIGVSNGSSRLGCVRQCMTDDTLKVGHAWQMTRTAAVMLASSTAAAAAAQGFELVLICLGVLLLDGSTGATHPDWLWICLHKCQICLHKCQRHSRSSDLQLTGCAAFVVLLLCCCWLRRCATL